MLGRREGEGGGGVVPNNLVGTVYVQYGVSFPHFFFYIGVCRSGFQIMLNSPVFFISREKKYLWFPPRENVKKPFFS